MIRNPFRRNGTMLLDSVLKNFEKAVANLETAAARIEAEQKQKRAEIDAAYLSYMAAERQWMVEDSQMAFAREKAEAVRSNIAKLIAQ